MEPIGFVIFGTLLFTVLFGGAFCAFIEIFLNLGSVNKELKRELDKKDKEIARLKEQADYNEMMKGIL